MSIPLLCAFGTAFPSFGFGGLPFGLGGAIEGPPLVCGVWMVTFFFVLMESEVSACGVDGTLWELASALAVPGSNRTLGGLVGGTSGLLADIPADLRGRPGLRAGILTEGKDGGVSVMGVEGGR